MSDFREGERVFARGLDGNCRHTIEESVFVRDVDAGRVVVKSADGIKVILPVSQIYKSLADIRAAIISDKNQ